MRAFHLTHARARLRILDSEAAGAPLVLAHGVGSSATFVIDAFGAPLADAGWRVVALDARGHGGSDPGRSPSDHRVETWAADLWAVARSVGARAVGGISLGAHAAVTAASEARGDVDVVLACIPAWTGRAVPGEGTHAGVAAAVAGTGVEPVIDGFGRDETLPGWLRHLLVRDWSAADHDSLVAALQSLDGGLAPTEYELRRLGVPLALVAWPDDPGHPLDVAEEWAGLAVRSALETIRMDDLEDDLTGFGRAAARALLRVSPAW